MSVFVSNGHPAMLAEALAVHGCKDLADVQKGQRGRTLGRSALPLGRRRLTGRLAGPAIEVLINWPQPVNGHMTADLRIVSLGRDRLQILVTDDGENGVPRVTTDLSLARR